MPPRPTVPLLLVLAAWLLSACATTPPAPELPAWVVDASRHPEAPSSRFLSAVGGAPGQGGQATASARAKALGTLSTSLTAQVVGEIELDSRAVSENGKTSWTDELVERARIRGSEELPGAEVVASHHDPLRDETHVLVSVRRDRLRDLLLDQVAGSLKAALAAGSRADALEPNAPGRAVQARLEAWQAASEAYAAAVRAWVAGDGDGPSVQARRQAAELEQQARDVLDARLGALRLVKTAGDDQLGHPRGSLEQRLALRVETAHPDGGMRPVADLPVRFQVADDLAQLAPSGSTTNLRGEITCAVTDLSRAPTSSTVVTAVLDATRLAPDLPESRLPRARFRYRLPTPAQTRILLDLRETFAEEPLASGLRAAVQGHLSQAGFSVVVADEPLAGSVSTLRARWGSTYEYVLRGAARVDVGSTQGSLQYLLLLADMEAIALDSGQVVQIIAEATGAGADASRTSASRAISRYLAPKLIAELHARFVADFLPGSPH